MDLSRFTNGQNTIILLPRFTRITDVVGVMVDYYNSRKQRVNIYQNLYEAYYFSKGTGNIVLVTWGFDLNLMESLLSKKKWNLLRVDFIPVTRAVRFTRKLIPLNTEMESWYRLIIAEDLSNEVKAMAGNHHYAIDRQEDKVFSLSRPEEYGSILGQNSVGLDSVSVEIDPLIVANLPTLRDVKINHGRHLSTDSPKIFDLISEYLGEPGKYVLFTSFIYAYGVKLFSHILKLAFGKSPIVIDTFTPVNRMKTLLREFNESKNNILVTNVVPVEDIYNIQKVIVFDSYEVPVLLNLLYKTCSKGCGSVTDPMTLVLLGIESSNFRTYDVSESEKALDTFRKFEFEYSFFEKSAKPIVIFEDKLAVITN